MFSFFIIFLNKKHICISGVLFYYVFSEKSSLQEGEEVVCANCDEKVVFLLKDSNNNEFTVGMKTILGCAAFAIQEGELPKLHRVG